MEYIIILICLCETIVVYFILTVVDAAAIENNVFLLINMKYMISVSLLVDVR